MLFNSIDFLFFFPIVLILYFFAPVQWRRGILLAASYWFYMSWNPRYGLLIAFSTFITWLSGIFIDRARSTPRGGGDKALIAGGCAAINLLILFFFKYFNFFWINLAAVLRLANIHIALKTFDVVLPVGISFYTFQALSYTFDVYRGKVEVERNFFRYALFVSFFPQLVAGPIERPTNLLSQIQCIDKLSLWDYRRITDGCKIMIYGYFLKMVVADRVAGYVNIVFGNYRAYNTSVLCLACVFFAVQIYCDFNSYSLIAIGSAKILGFTLMENFDAPYFSRSVSEFWRRWHISLNSWFRDYLYIPLGGNRCSKWRKTVNVMIVFLVSGLWHGANWTFIIWGGLNGLYQVAGSFLKPIKDKLNEVLRTKTNSFGYKALQTMITFVLVDIAWVFFRAESARDALSILWRIASRWDPWVLTGSNVLQNLLPAGMQLIELQIALACVFAVFAVDALKYCKKSDLHVLLEKECIWFRWGIYILLLVLILVYGVYGADFQSVDFIYFQF